VDDSGLIDFHDKYFPYPLYRDENLEFYKYLGDRKYGIPISFNPLDWIGGILKLLGTIKRLLEKGIDGNMSGEAFTRGGVVIFGKDGDPCYAYQEDGDLPIDGILAAVSVTKKGK